MNSLKDQLLKAGLVKPAVKKRPKAQPKQRPKQQPQQQAPTTPKKGRKKVGENTLRTQRAMLDKAKKDKVLNEKRRLEAERKARYAQIKQLVDGSKLDRKGGEVTFNFTCNKKVKTIYVSDEQQKQLSADLLAIIAMDGELFEIVPIKAADEIAERESHRIIRNKKHPAKLAADDPYANFQIPDDLVW